MGAVIKQEPGARLGPHALPPLLACTVSSAGLQGKLRVHYGFA